MLLLLLLVMFILPDGWWVGLVVMVVMQGVKEWSKLSGLSGWQTYLYLGLTLMLMLALLRFDALHTSAGQFVLHLAVYAVSAVLWLIIVPVWMIAAWKIDNRYLLCLTGWAILIPTGLAMLDLRAVSPRVLLLLMALVWVADIGAYFAGRKFGKHKLAPAISPGKTWEGVAGGLLGVSLYVFFVHALMPFTPLRVIMLAGWFWVGLAVLGDLFESLMKRHAGVKDSGALLPGHGGLLDRIDALTSTLPLAAMVLMLEQFFVKL